MTNIELKAYYKQQAEWHKGQAQFYEDSIKWYREAAKKSRKEDREFIAWVMQNPNYSDAEKAATKGFKSSETKSNEKLVRKHRTMLKQYLKWVAYYESELAKLA